MKRFGQLIGLRPEVLEEYKRYHAAVWPEILGAIREGGHPQLLDLPPRREALRLLRVPRARRGVRGAHARARPRPADARVVGHHGARCSGPLEGRAPGAWWADMEEVFHTD